MKLKLKNTPEQVELIKAMGSRNGTESREALEAFAAFVGPVIQKVLNESALSAALYSDMAYDEDDSPSIPLDLYYNEDAGLISVWSQNVAGGLPTSTVDVPVQEMKFSTYRLDSAVSFHKRYARKSRLDVVSKAIERMTQEVLIKQERNAWAVVLKALAEAATKNGRAVAPGTAGSLRHLINGGGDFTLESMNKLVTRMKRVSQSFAGGTPAGGDARGITDLYVSPEIKAAIRAFAYNPMFPTGATLSQSQLPENVREEIYRSAGTEEIYGISIHELIELGVSQRYTELFDSLFNVAATPAGGTDTEGYYNTGGFPNTAEVLIGVDATRDAFVRPVARQAESGGEFVVLPDDQFYAARQDKTGFYGFVEEGRVCLDARAVAGVVIT